jgi:hypothetical protein
MDFTSGGQNVAQAVQDGFYGGLIGRALDASSNARYLVSAGASLALFSLDIPITLALQD